MEKFLFLFRGGMTSGSPEAMQANMQEWFAWVEKLRKEGRYISGEPLHPAGKTVVGAKRIITDGPYAEGKELVGGFFIVDAKDLDEATEMAKASPDYKNGGSVEVRQVMKM